MRNKPRRFNANRGVAHSSVLNATANLMKEQRLSQSDQMKQQVAQQVEQAESKLPKTQESLNTLGAGQPYGQNN